MPLTQLLSLPTMRVLTLMSEIAACGRGNGQACNRKGKGDAPAHSSIRSKGAQQSEETMLSLRAQLVGLMVQFAATGADP
jgi:hypothetical protein